jgi:hypothetical protein
MLLHTEEFKNWGIRLIDENLTFNTPGLNLTPSERAAWRAG